jgi:WD40 repeat protein
MRCTLPVVRPSPLFFSWPKFLTLAWLALSVSGGFVLAEPGSVAVAQVLSSTGTPLPPAARTRFGSLHFSHSDWVQSFALSPDGQTLASVAQEPHADIWRIADGRRIARLPATVGRLTVAYSPDGKGLAVAATGELTLWDPATFRPRWKCPLPEGGSSLCFSPDGTTLACGSWNGNITFLDVSSGKRRLTLKGAHTAPQKHPSPVVWSLAFSPDGRLLASTGGREEHRCLKVWKLPSGELLYRRRLAFVVGCVAAFSPDGKALLSGDTHLRCWEPATGKLLWSKRWEPEVVSLAFSPDGQTLAVGEKQARDIPLLDLPSGKVNQRIRVPHPLTTVESLTFSGDGKVLAWKEKEYATLTLWDVSAGRYLHPEPRHWDCVWSLASTRKGDILFTVGGEGMVHSWRRKDGTHLRRVGQLKPGRLTLALSGDEQTLAVGLRTDGPIRLWNLATGKERCTLPAQPSFLWDLAFLGQEDAVLTGDGRWNLRLWEGSSGKQRWKWQPGKDLRGLGIAPGGKRLATYERVITDKAVNPEEATGIVRVWRIQDRKELFALEESSPGRFWLFGGNDLLFVPESESLVLVRTDGVVRQIDLAVPRMLGLEEWSVSKEDLYRQYSCSGNTLAVGHCDGTLGLWDLLLGQEVACWQGDKSQVCSLLFVNNGRQLVSGYRNSTALLWDLPTLALGPRQAWPRFSDDQLWQDLASSKATQSWRAMWRLVVEPRRALVLLEKRLHPATGPSSAQLARWITDLGSDQFATREKASRALVELGELAGPALKQALREKDTDAEARRRLQLALQRIDHPGYSAEQRRTLRALEALALIGTRQARRLLEGLAKGAPETLITRRAQASLQRFRDD